MKSSTKDKIEGDHRGTVKTGLGKLTGNRDLEEEEGRSVEGACDRLMPSLFPAFSNGLVVAKFMPERWRMTSSIHRLNTYIYPYWHGWM